MYFAQSLSFPFPNISNQRKEELTQCTLKIIDERLKHSEKTLAQQILSDICASKNGIRNLIITYQEDTMFCCSIETYLQTIDAKLGEYQQKYPDIFPTPGDSEESIGDITTHAINRSE